MHFYHEQANLLEGAARLVDPETAVRRMRRVDQLRSMRYEDGLQNHALVGTPEAIAERLKTLRREIGLTGILAELNCGGLIPHQRVLTALRLLCKEVKPQLVA
jgi:alkanesulfonate monooxygenase SsuD/methylene tetrahydromethanopterin reductase-like flavin-dependent oxidoreductase (luciferase family)